MDGFGAMGYLPIAGRDSVAPPGSRAGPAIICPAELRAPLAQAPRGTHSDGMTDTHPPSWPSVPLAAWRDTRDTLHLWTQIVGKIRLAKTPWLNHGWHVVLYVSPRGLTTSAIPHGSRSFEIEFDFILHTLEIRSDDGEMRRIELVPRTVADFYTAVMTALRELRLPVTINDLPSEIAGAIRFNRKCHTADSLLSRVSRVYPSAHERHEQCVLGADTEPEDAIPPASQC